MPFLLEELLAACLGEDGTVDAARALNAVPLTLADAVRRRVAALPDECRGLLHLAAVVGLRSDVALLSAATGRTVQSVHKALQPARQVQLLSTQEPCAFRHAITRDAVLLGLLPGERTAIARLLHDAAEEVGTEPELVASLAERVGRPAAAARAWVTLAAGAVAIGAPGGAEEALQYAAALVSVHDAPELAAAVALCRLHALAQAGRTQEVRCLAAELVAGPEALRQPAALRQVRLGAARAALDAGDLASVVDASLLAEQAREAGDEPVWARTALAALGAVAAHDLPAAERHARAVLAGSAESRRPRRTARPGRCSDGCSARTTCPARVRRSAMVCRLPSGPG